MPRYQRKPFCACETQRKNKTDAEEISLTQPKSDVPASLLENEGLRQASAEECRQKQKLSGQRQKESWIGLLGASLVIRTHASLNPFDPVQQLLRHCTAVHSIAHVPVLKRVSKPGKQMQMYAHRGCDQRKKRKYWLAIKTLKSTGLRKHNVTTGR